MSFNDISPPFSDSDTDSKRQKGKPIRTETEKTHKSLSSLEAERISHHNRKHDDKAEVAESSYRHRRRRSITSSRSNSGSSTNKDKSSKRKCKSKHTWHGDSSNTFNDSDDSTDELCEKEVAHHCSYKDKKHSSKSHHEHHHHHHEHHNEHDVGHNKDRYHERKHHHHDNDRSTNRTSRKRRHSSLSTSSSSSSSSSSISSLSSEKSRHGHHRKLKERSKRKRTSHKKYHSHSAHHKTSRKELLLKSENFTLDSHAHENDDREKVKQESNRYSNDRNLSHEEYTTNTCEEKSNDLCDNTLIHARQYKNDLTAAFNDKAGYSSAYRIERNEKYNLPNNISSPSSSLSSSSSSISMEQNNNDVECVPTSEWVCGVCSNLNSAQRTDCYRCGIAYKKSVATTQSRSIRISNVEESEVNAVLEIIHNVFMEHKDSFASALDVNVCNGNISSNNNCNNNKDNIFASIQHYYDNSRKRLYLCLPSVAIAVNIMVYCKCQVELNSISLRSELNIVNKNSSNNNDNNEDEDDILEMLEEKKKICPLSFSHRCNVEKMCAHSNSYKNSINTENNTVETGTESEHYARTSNASSFPAELAHDVWTPPTSFASHDAEKQYLEMLSANWTNLSSNQKSYYDEHVRKQLSLQVCMDNKSPDDRKTNSATDSKELHQNNHSNSLTSQSTSMKNTNAKQSTHTEAENATAAIADVNVSANNNNSNKSNNNNDSSESKVTKGKTSSTLEDLKKRLTAKLQSKASVKQYNQQHEKKELESITETTPFVLETADEASQKSLTTVNCNNNGTNKNNRKTDTNKNVAIVSKSSETLASITALKAKLLEKKKLLSKVEDVAQKDNKATADMKQEETDQNVTSSQSVDQLTRHSEEVEGAKIKANCITNNDSNNDYAGNPQTTTIAGATNSFAFLYNFPLPPCFSPTENAGYKIKLDIPHELAQRLLPPREIINNKCLYIV